LKIIKSLKAWDLVKDTNWPKKDRLWLRVKHAFNKEDYLKYYSEQLEEHPVKEEYATQADRIYPRFQWMVKSIISQGAKTLIDLGCADGYLPLTLASKGLNCVGYNLYKPSVDLANKRAGKFKVAASFICDDLFNAKGEYDAVVLSEVLEHLPDPQAAIDHCMS
jgi:2-polyprenyl-3-methyl-5-hydroxy-6-metoxy-1,4-benzoquinol methylase